MPPIVFPWKIFDDEGKIVPEQDFIFITRAGNSSEKRDAAAHLFKLYKEIWSSAKEAVKFATKISFVGLSMHRYMEQGLKFLFEGKAGKIDVVVANKTDDIENLCHNVGALLRTIAPNVEAKGSWRDKYELAPEEKGVKTYFGDYGMTPRKSFREFIEKEMN